MKMTKPSEHPEMQHIQGTHHPIRDFEMDPGGYFLIRINPEAGLIEAGLCRKDNIILRKITGRTAEEVGYTIVKQKLTSHLQHLVYLGKELEKAEICLKLGLDYVQDEPFDVVSLRLRD